MTATDLRFSSPPVRAVELTLFFERVPLRLTAIAPLVGKLTTKFPVVTERFARLPWVEEDNAEQAPRVIEEGSERFPFPWLTFANNDGHSVSFQDDRIIVRWEFGAGAAYPGYDQLKGSMKEHFDDFCRHATISGTQKVSVRKARVEYENVTDKNAAWSVAKQTYSSDPSAPGEPLSGIQSTNAGGLFHFTDSGTATHVEFAAFSDPENGTLSLRATTEVPENGLTEAEVMDLAHTHLIDCFQALTTPEQHDGWGKL